MPRPPKDDVAASTTITLRLTPDDRQRIERQVEARAAELPERSMSALLRRLVRDSEEGVLRLPPEERALLDRLVTDRTAELARLGVYEAQVTPSSIVVGLVRDAARAKGLAPSAPQVSAAAVEPSKSETPAKEASKPPAAPDAKRVHAALVAVLEGGTVKQGDLARQTGIDTSHLYRFKKSGAGLGAERLEKLAQALGVHPKD